MSNSELDSIKPFLHSGATPVIIASQLNWVDTAQLGRDAGSLKKRMAQWLADWQSRDVDAYLDYYSRSFRSDAKDYSAWAEHKQRVNQQKEFIKVTLSDVSILRYPDQSSDMVVVSFEQDYRSNNFNGKSRKRQYWQKEADGQWRIIYEGKG